MMRLTGAGAISLVLRVVCLVGCAAACAPIASQVLTSADQDPSRFLADGYPETYGHGRIPSATEISEWDIDIRPDGEGLPVGTGSVEEGRDLYAAQCAICHGARGVGGPFDVLAGRVDNDGFPFADAPATKKTIGNYWPYATTIFDYTRRAMPQDRPGSLADDEVYALTAYLLFLNGLLDSDARLDRTSLPKIEMPSRDRFVPDDRRGGAEIR